MKHVIDKKFREIHYPRDPGKWMREKNRIRERAYYLALYNGPEMASMFHIRRAKCDLSICGVVATDSDVSPNATAHSWTDPNGLHVVCSTCYIGREAMDATTPRAPVGVFPFEDAYEAELEELDRRALARDLEPRDEKFPNYTENEVRTALEFWGEFPVMEPLAMDNGEIEEDSNVS